MPKQRVHAGAKKRFRRSPKGKVLHQGQNHNHLLEHKTSTRKRRIARQGQLTGKRARNVLRLLGKR